MDNVHEAITRLIIEHDEEAYIPTPKVGYDLSMMGFAPAAGNPSISNSKLRVDNKPDLDDLLRDAYNNASQEDIDLAKTTLSENLLNYTTAIALGKLVNKSTSFTEEEAELICLKIKDLPANYQTLFCKHIRTKYLAKLIDHKCFRSIAENLMTVIFGV